MQKDNLSIVIILFANLGFSLEHSKYETTAVTKNNQTTIKNVYHIQLLDFTITTEDIQFYENKSMFAVLNGRLVDIVSIINNIIFWSVVFYL